MTMLAIDDKPEALRELAENLQVVFPQETIAAFAPALQALQYAFQYSKKIGLVFTAMPMKRMDGIALANSVKRVSPGAAAFLWCRRKTASPPQPPGGMTMEPVCQDL